MSDFKIFTDSTADLPAAEIAAMDITVIPLLITIRDNSYRDGVDIRTPRLLELVGETGELPKSAAPSVHDFCESFRPYLEAGRKVMYISLSSKISSIHANACLAKTQLEEDGVAAPGQIAVIDSLNLCGGEGALVRMAYRFGKQGLEFDEIVDKLRAIAPNYKLFFTMDSLKYLHKGGRCSLSQVILSSTLNIKPVIAMSEDGLSFWKKARGKKNALRLMLDELSADRDRVIMNELHVACITGIESDRDALKAEMTARTGIEQVFEYNIGCVIATHCGEGTIGFGYFLEP